MAAWVTFEWVSKYAGDLTGQPVTIVRTGEIDAFLGTSGSGERRVWLLKLRDDGVLICRPDMDRFVTTVKYPEGNGWGYAFKGRPEDIPKPVCRVEPVDHKGGRRSGRRRRGLLRPHAQAIERHELVSAEATGIVQIVSRDHGWC
jgi:hypothetical protein